MTDAKKKQLTMLEKAFPGRGKFAMQLIDFAAAESARKAAECVRVLAAPGKAVTAKALLDLAQTLDDVAKDLEK